VAIVPISTVTVADSDVTEANVILKCRQISTDTVEQGGDRIMRGGENEGDE
jgi:hypothetical protein